MKINLELETRIISPSLNITMTHLSIYFFDRPSNKIVKRSGLKLKLKSDLSSKFILADVARSYEKI